MEAGKLPGGGLEGSKEASISHTGLPHTLHFLPHLLHFYVILAFPIAK